MRSQVNNRILPPPVEHRSILCSLREFDGLREATKFSRLTPARQPQSIVTHTISRPQFRPNSVLASLLQFPARPRPTCVGTVKAAAQLEPPKPRVTEQNPSGQCSRPHARPSRHTPRFPTAAPAHHSCLRFTR